VKTIAIGMLLICGTFIISISTHLSMPMSTMLGAIGGAMLMAVVIMLTDDRDY